MNPYSIVQEPVISEKATEENGSKNQVTFKVNKLATKQQVKVAVEMIYPNVKVLAVRTSNMPGKKKRLRLAEGYTAGWKKAVVQLKEGGKIEFQ